MVWLGEGDSSKCLGHDPAINTGCTQLFICSDRDYCVTIENGHDLF